MDSSLSGLSDAESCGDGIQEFRSCKVRDQDENIGTITEVRKGFVSLRAELEMWTSWGSVTGVRIGKGEQVMS